jgi:aminoglycoside phosphotransferase (APT) family kinase protein
MTATLKDMTARLEMFLTEQIGTAARIVAARQLTGGASRDTWAIDVAVSETTQPLVLRRDLGGEIMDSALSREQEFRLLQIVHEAGVLAPRPRWLCNDPSVLGAPFFLMDRLEGESVGRRIVREPALAEARRRLPAQMAEQLTRIHAIIVPQSNLSFLATTTAEEALRQTTEQLWRLKEPHPALELAIRWLAKRVPVRQALVLVHGDFRIGNLMVGPAGLVGVFDWEFTHLGDPAEDLAWPSVRSWRFGQDALRLGGIAQDDEFLMTYERLSGRTIDRARVAFWEVLGNLRWAVGCIAQADRHLAGKTISVELASLGRRTAEMELELLDLIGRLNRAGEVS